MADTEEYFPRGGKKPTTTHFKQSANFLGAPERGEKKKKKPKKKAEGDDGYLSDEGTKEIDQSFKNCAFGLSYKTVKEGLLILGRVKNILETKIVISLPCRLIGSIMACHISEAYNKLLEDYVNDKTEKVLELGQMFRVGQYLAVKVLEVKELSIMLSLMPQHVNAQKTNADLQKGSLLQAAVSSVEDHGYVMDIGLPNTRAFLPKTNTNPDIELDIGMVTWCSIKSTSDSGVITLSNELVALQNSWLRKKTTGPLLPGSTVEFLVDTPLDNGIEGHVFGDTTAYIQRQHADTVKGKKPALGQKIRARLLYVMPTRNTPFLTMKNIFETSYPDVNAEQKLKDGEIVEDAQVLKITGRSIHFRLPKGCFGTMSLKRIQVDEDLTDEEVVAKSYPIGSTHKVRILCYNLSDYVYSITDQPDVLTERYFSIDQLKPGDIVDATVKTVADNHVLLNVGRVSGYVPQSHISDSGIYLDPKKNSISKLPKKKYKVGQAVKARVLSVDPVKQTLFLTLKPSLLTPDLDVLHSYHNVDIGKAYTGVIKTVRDFVLVNFFNNVVAYVPRQYVTKEPIEDLTQAFHVGQIVNCTILRVDPDAQKMTGSLTTVPFWPAKKRELPEKRNIKHTEEEIPNKKAKIDRETELQESKKKKKKSEVVEEDSDTKQNTVKENKKDKKSKKKSKAETTEEMETNEERQSKKDKNKKRKLSNEEKPDTEPNTVIENKKDKKSKNKLKAEATDELAHNEKENKREKKKKNKLKSNEEELTAESKTDQVEEQPRKDKKKKQKVKEETKSSEESDAIETDVYEDTDQVLTPQDLALIDLTDCTTLKQYKKRVVSLIKSVKNRTTRLNKVERKIARIEEKGLDSENKKFHTAMQAEKLVVQERIKKLLDALKIAQEKLKEIGGDEIEFTKKGKENRKEEKAKSVEEGVKVKKEMAIKVAESLEPALEAPSVKDFWSASTDSLSKKVEVEESSSDEDEDKDQPKKKRKKLTVAEKLAKAREEEERLRELEKRAIESESQPRSSEQFERALLANPNSSQLWIAYMAFYLQSTEVEKARNIARRALKTISFREESEKLNVWLAMINFENRFGTKESQQSTLEEALQMNDPYQIHSKLLDIYVETSKHQELTALVDLMLRKYKRNPTMYTACGAACFKLGLVEKARQVMQKAIAVLEKKEHVSVLVQFALLERDAGALERAEALFEQVLAVYSQRVDVASSYVDMLRKTNDLDRIRQVMERMTSLKLPARKMKILYKKWLEVEEKYGDQEQVEKIKQRAMEYLQKAKF